MPGSGKHLQRTRLGWCGREPLGGTFHWRAGERPLKRWCKLRSEWQDSHASISITHPCHLILHCSLQPLPMSAPSLLCAKLLANTGVLLHHGLAYAVLSIPHHPVSVPLVPIPEFKMRTSSGCSPQIIKKQGADQRTSPSFLPDQRAPVGSCEFPIHSVTGAF